MIGTAQFRICDVCRLCDWDTTEKLCTFCPLCDAWICSEDANRWGRRLKAAAKRKLEFGFKGDPLYTENIKNQLIQSGRADEARL